MKRRDLIKQLDKLAKGETLTLTEDGNHSHAPEKSTSY